MSRGSKGGRKRGGSKQSSGSSRSSGASAQGTSKNGNTKRTGRSRGRSKKAKQNPAVFWGNPESLPTREHAVSPGQNVHAIVESLGRAPIPGQEANAAHYFALVYDRAASLALALAAAGGINEPVEDAEDLDKD
ncbi:MAG: hypothetical protein IH940_05945 [Acidobacteria bacterium]|nr:hypothetical protein [Acidobacteriota bacterium]